MKIVFFYNLRRLDIESQAEYDTPETVGRIASALEAIDGATVSAFDVTGKSLSQIAYLLQSAKPDVVFSTAAGSKGRLREAALPLLLETMGIPYVGSDAHTCTIAHDKHLCKLLAASLDIPTPEGALLTDPLDPFPIVSPLILKPNYEGSSKGVSIDSVHSYQAERLTGHISQLLYTYPDGILAEAYIPGRDVTVPVLHRPLGVCGLEIVGTDGSLYSYKLKHETPDAVRLLYPAVLDWLTQKQQDEILLYSAKLCVALRIKDLARLDFRVAHNGKIYFLEINALPALDPDVSLFHLADKIFGWDYNEVIRILIMAAINRGPRHTAL